MSRTRRGADEIHRRDGYDNPVGEKQLITLDWFTWVLLMLLTNLNSCRFLSFALSLCFLPVECHHLAPVYFSWSIGSGLPRRNYLPQE
jgi:hypothetical protein